MHGGKGDRRRHPGSHERRKDRAADVPASTPRLRALFKRGSTRCRAAGPGRDTLIGGSGNDFFNSKDGTPDTVTGGPGADRGLVDPGVDRVSGVEKYNRK